jgi:tetratricopeptide (TPR) repeat protein
MLFNEVLLGLKTLTGKPNLLLIDNAEASLSQYIDRLPNQPNWHLLVTSRENIERLYQKKIGFLIPEKALELFQKYCTLIKDEKAINDLLFLIDSHTLTIEILARTAQKLRLGITVLKNAIINDLISPIYINHKGDKIDRVRTYLCSIFDLSKLNENEIWLMKQFACLPSDFFSYDFFIELFYPKVEEIEITHDSKIYKATKHRPENFQDEILAGTLSDLTSKGWLMYNPESDVYKMHIIIKDIIHQKLIIEVENVKGVIIWINKKLHFNQVNDSPMDKFYWIEYGKSILFYFPEILTKELSELNSNLALVLKSFGDYFEAKKLMEKVVSYNENISGTDSPVMSVSYSNLASVLNILGENQKAKFFIEKAIIISNHSFGEAHKTTITNYINLAVILHSLNEIVEARVVLEKMMKLSITIFGELHSISALIYSNLSSVLVSLNDFDGAEKLLEKSIVSSEKEFGENHPTTINRYCNFADFLRCRGDFNGAKKIIQKAILSNEKILGNEHPRTATSYSILGLIHKDLRKYNDAIELFKKSMNVDLKIFGEYHSLMVVRYYNLGATLLESNLDYNYAIILLEKALSIQIRNYGEKDEISIKIKKVLNQENQ